MRTGPSWDFFLGGLPFAYLMHFNFYYFLALLAS